MFKMNKERLNVLSSGGGTQSNAIICMIHAGTLPKPDIVVMIDTEREASNVIEYQHKWIKPLCDDIGLPFHIVKKSEYVNDDIYSAKGRTLPPFFSTLNGRNTNGECKGKQPGFCSSIWKKDTVHRFLNRKYGQQELTKRGVDLWIGMSLDEPKRVKITGGK